MPALAPPEGGSRQRHAGKAALREREALSRRPASFHGRGDSLRVLGPRTRTHPDLHLLDGVGPRSSHGGGADGFAAAATAWAACSRAAPSLLLVTVAVQRSVWPLHVMARAEWRVADLVTAAVELYVREGRRPLLPSGEPSAFGLHYSQFSLQGLDPESKLIELGSRSFFLCPRAAAAAASSSCSSTEASKAMATSADKPSIAPPWPWVPALLAAGVV